MALPSQMERGSEMPRSSMARDARAGGGNRKTGIIIAGLLAAAGAVYGLWFLASRGGTGPQESEAATSSLASDPRSTTPPPPPQSLVPQGSPAAPSPQPPVSLNQGAQRGVLGAALDRQPSTTPGSQPGAQPGTQPRPVDPTRPQPVDVTGGGVNLPAGARPQPATPAGTPGTVPGTQPAVGPDGVTPVDPTLAPAVPSSEAVRLAADGERAIAENRLVEARSLLNRALRHPETTASERARLRESLSRLNEDLLFSPRIVAGDPMVESYTVASGDSLVRIARRRELATDWRLIQRVNRMSNPNALRVGQTLKLVRGPFHAIVTKSEYRLDLYSGPPDDPSRWVFIRSFRVGLGEGNSTPVGTFTIRRNSKLINPPWVNPRTGERFSADDPKNPIGEYWLGFEGLGSSAVLTGYGIHGTIEPDSIGQQRSMGCVRMLDDDVSLIYGLLVEQVSVVKVEP